MANVCINVTFPCTCTCPLFNNGQVQVQDHVTQPCKFKTELMKLDMMLNGDKMKLFDYKNPKITAYLEISGTRSFLRCEKWECSISLWNTLFACFFLAFVICIKIRFFSVSNWTLCSIFYASKRKTSASQDAMTHSGYISDCCDFNIFSSQGLLPSDLVAQTVEWHDPKVMGSIPTLVRVFLCPCVGPFPSVGLTLTWFIWDRILALHITHYPVNSV